MQAFNGNQFVIRVGLLNDVENLEDFMGLVLHINEPQFLSLVLSYEVDQFTALFDFIQTLDKFIGKSVNPFNELVLDFN